MINCCNNYIIDYIFFKLYGIFDIYTFYYFYLGTTYNITR